MRSPIRSSSDHPPAQMDVQDTGQEGFVDYGEFDIEGFTNEEIKAYNSIAEPGQKLGDAFILEQTQDTMRRFSCDQDGIGLSSLSKSRQIVSFAREHPFMEKIDTEGTFTKSERRQFERDVYDFGKALGLGHAAAKKQVVRTRALCGEEGYDSDSSALANEFEDSAAIMRTLAAKTGPNPVVLSSIKDLPQTAQLPTSRSKATTSPKKSPYFSPASAKKAPSKKRKASAILSQIANDVDESQALLQPSKRIRHDSSSAESHLPEVNKVLQTDDQVATSLSGLPVHSINSSWVDAIESMMTNKGLDETGSVTGSISRTMEDVTTIQKETKKARRVRKRAGRELVKEDRQMGEECASEFKNLESDSKQTHVQDQGQPENRRQETNTALDLNESLDSAKIASTELVTKPTKPTKHKLRSEVQKRRRRVLAAKSKAERAPGVQPIEIAEGNDPDRKRKGGRDKNAVNDHSNSKGPKAKGMDHSMELNGEQNYQPQGFLKELDRVFSIATETRLVSPPATEKPTPRSTHSRTQVPSTRKLRSHTTDSPKPAKAQESEDDDEAVSHGKKKKRKGSKSAKKSPYFTSTPSKRPPPISCIPFPPLSSTRFGLVQETLAHSPFRLLLACIFLNKTRGSVALPVFYDLMARYPTPSALAAAKHEDVVDVIHHLGLQNQRANTCINLAKAWLERVPVKGRRRRVLNYPCKGDGKDLKPGEVIEDDDERVAWEVGQLPGVGVYAIDSWRIFCRDDLRGLPIGLPNEVTEESKEEEMRKEWSRVLPLDKELRAYLRWRWLRNGIVWDPLTGEKRPAGEEDTEKAAKGGVIVEGEDTGIIVAGVESKELRALSEGKGTSEGA